MGWFKDGDWDRATTPPGASTGEIAVVMAQIARAINQRWAVIIRGANTAADDGNEYRWYYTDALAAEERAVRPTAAQFAGAKIRGACVRRFVIDAQAQIDRLVQQQGTGDSWLNPVFLRERDGHELGTLTQDFWTRDGSGSEEKDFHTAIGAWIDIDEVGVMYAPMWLQLKDALDKLRYVCTYQGLISTFGSVGTQSEVWASGGLIDESGTGAFPEDADAACALRGSAGDVIAGAIEDLSVSSVPDPDPVRASFYFRNTVTFGYCDGDTAVNYPTAETARSGSVQFARSAMSFAAWASRRRGRAAGTAVQFFARVRSYVEDVSAQGNQIVDLVFCGDETFTPVAWPDSVEFEREEFPTTLSLEAADDLAPLPGISPGTILSAWIYQRIAVVAAVSDISGLLDDQT